MKYINTSLTDVIEFKFVPRSNDWNFLQLQDKATKDIITIIRSGLNTTIADDGEVVLEIPFTSFANYEKSLFDVFATIIQNDFSASNVVYYTLLETYSDDAEKGKLNVDKYVENDTPSETNTDYITL